MNPHPLNLETLFSSLCKALEPLDYTHAMWQAGAAAFNRLDAWSDLDLMIVVDDERVNDTFEVIEAVLTDLSPIDLKYEIPQPTWHGHSQTFYRLENAGPFLLLDVCVMKLSNPERFLEPEIHGQPVVCFDKSGVVAESQTPLGDRSDLLRDRLASRKVIFDLFKGFPLKELYRGNPIEALAYYQAFILRPLVEVLRIHHYPARYDFYTRYIYYDLPSEIVKELEPLFFISSPSDLEAKIPIASAWLIRLVEENGDSGHN
jgi:hypothetical protein